MTETAAKASIRLGTLAAELDFVCSEGMYLGDFNTA
jgi:hypothetical protein